MSDVMPAQPEAVPPPAAGPTLAVGQRWKVVRQHGNDRLQGTTIHPELGQIRSADVEQAAPLRVGIVGTISRFVPAEVPGAHSYDEDCAVLDFPVFAVGEAAPGEVPALIQVARSVSFGITSVEDPHWLDSSMFELVVEQGVSA